jgi:CRISPR system Cascade subunit CasA
MDGSVGQYGVVGLLEAAHELAGLVEPAPSVQLGIYRFLIAFVMDAYSLKEIWQIEDLLRTGGFEPERIRAYIDLVGRSRFDLFHPEHPFMQPLVEGEAGTECINKLFQHLPSGSFTTHFHHLDPAAQAFAPAVCARGLLAIPPFMTAGGAGYSPSVNGAPPWYVLVKGTTLFETIVLNCCVLPIPELEGDEPPAWRTERPVKPRQEARCTSLLEGLTWRPRQIRLIPSEGGVCTYSGQYSDVLVRQMRFSFGFKYGGGWTDPQVAYRIDANGQSPLRPREGRELWRDIGPVAFLRRHEYESERGKVRFQRPQVVEQYVDLLEMGALPHCRSVIDLEVFGVRTDLKMKIFEWQCERLSLPTQVAETPGAGARIQTGLEMAETVGYLVGRAMKMAYPREGKSNTQAFKGLIESAEREFWAGLRPCFEAEYMLKLPDLDASDPEAFPALLEEWRTILRRHGREVLDRHLEGLDANAQELRRQVAARDSYELGVYRALYGPREKQESQSKRKGRQAS